MRSLTRTLATVGTLAAAAVLAAAPAGGAPARGFHVEGSSDPGPDAPFQIRRLNDVAVASTDIAWAVGSVELGPNDQSPIILRRQGKSWRNVAFPKPASQAALTGISALSTRAAWAVGWRGNNGQTPFVLRYAHARWHKVSLGAAGTGFAPKDVLATAPDDVWIAGNVVAGPGWARPAAVHWNGQSWRAFSLPPAFRPSDQFDAVPTSVAGIPGTSKLIVAGFVGGEGIAGEPFADLWTGRRWRPMQMPSLNYDGYGNPSVVALSSRNAWLVSSRPVGSRYRFPAKTLVEHWNGTRWRIVKSPNAPGHNSNYLVGIAAHSARDIVAVGWSADWHARTGSSPQRTLAMRFDGTSWRIVPTANPDRSTDALLGVDSVPGGGYVAVGARTLNRRYTFGTPDDVIAKRTLVERWAGPRRAR
jgi:hypothetical protein